MRGLHFKRMTPWSFQWISNFWRLSSPSSFLAAHLSLAWQIWACSSEHVKEYVTASIRSQHYWRMKYINMKILWGWDHPLLSQFSKDPAKLCARQFQKNSGALCKKWLLNMPTCCQHLRCYLPPNYNSLRSCYLQEGYAQTHSYSINVLLHLCWVACIDTTPQVPYNNH